MTIAEYNSLRQQIEERYRGDMAALERVFYIVNGINPPGAVVALSPREPKLAVQERQHQMGEPLDTTSARRVHGMKCAWARKRAKKDGREFDDLTPEQQEFYIKGGKHLEDAA